MGALDDLIAQDERERRGAAGPQGMSALDQMIQQDIAAQSPSDDPEKQEAPGFVGYEAPAVAPEAPPEADPWAELQTAARGLFTPSNDQNAAIEQARAKMGGGTEPVERAAEAMVGGALPGGPAGKGFLPAVGRAGVQAVEGMGMDAASRVRDAAQAPEGAPQEDLAQQAREILKTGGVSAALSGAGAVGGMLGKSVAGATGRMADRWRNVVAGGTAADAKAAAKVYGLDAIDDPGRLLEKYSPSPPTGMESRGHARVIEDKLKASGGRLGDLVSEAEKMGLGKGAADVDANVARMLQEDSANMAKRARSQIDVQKAKAFADSSDLIGLAEPATDLRSVIDNKSRLQSQGHTAPGGTVPENAAAEVNAKAGSYMRDELHGIMSGSPRNQEYLDENQQYSELATLLKSLTSKAGGEQSGGAPAIIGSALAGAGVAGGGAVLTGHDPWEAAGAAAGGAAITGTNSAVRQMLGTRGADMDANMMRATQRGAGAVGEALSGLRSGAITASDRGQTMIGNQPREKPPGADVAVGHTKVADLVKSDPGALGGYASMLQLTGNAQDDAARISKLRRTQPEFDRIVRELEDKKDQIQPSHGGGLQFSMEQQ